MSLRGLIEKRPGASLGFHRWLGWWLWCYLPFLYDPCFLNTLFLAPSLLYSPTASSRYSLFFYTTLYFHSDELIAVSSSQCDWPSDLWSINRFFKSFQRLKSAVEEHRALYSLERLWFSFCSIFKGWNISRQGNRFVLYMSFICLPVLCFSNLTHWIRRSLCSWTVELGGCLLVTGTMTLALPLDLVGCRLVGALFYPWFIHSPWMLNWIGIRGVWRPGQCFGLFVMLLVTFLNGICCGREHYIVSGEGGEVNGVSMRGCAWSVIIFRWVG